MSKTRPSMKYAVLLSNVVLALPSLVLAQDTVEATLEAPTAVERPAVEQPVEAQPVEQKKKRGPYYKKVQGLLWLEGLVGFTSFDPDKFGGISTDTGTKRKRT